MNYLLYIKYYIAIHPFSHLMIVLNKWIYQKYNKLVKYWLVNYHYYYLVIIKTFGNISVWRLAHVK